jgi:long-chain acyl-CoA synthetase
VEGSARQAGRRHDRVAAESIRRFRILDDDFTVESGQLSAKLGIRRSVLAKDFAADIDMLYS